MYKFNDDKSANLGNTSCSNNTFSSNNISCIDQLPYHDKLLNNFKVISITHRGLCTVPLCEQIEKLCRLGVKDFILREKDMTCENYTKLAKDTQIICRKYNANLILHSFWQAKNIPIENSTSQLENHGQNKIHEPNQICGQNQNHGQTQDQGQNKDHGQNKIHEPNQICGQNKEFNKIHFPLWLLERDFPKIKSLNFTEIGCSCHSIQEAKKAIDLGATYITASHIYPTDCKKGLEPRGLEFLSEICDFVKSKKGDTFPVYALGGIKLDGTQFHELKKAGADGACLMSGLMKL